MKYLFYLMAFFAPMGAKFLSFSFGSYQMSPFRVITIIIFLLLLIKGKIVLYSGLNQRFSVCFNIVWFAYAIISVIWAKDFSSWFRNLFFIFVGVIAVIIAVNVVRTTEDVIASFTALNLGIAFQSFIGWYEVFTSDYRFFNMTGRNYDIFVGSKSGIPIAMTGNPNNFATMMFVGVFISLCCFLHAKNKIVRIIFIVLSISYVVLIFKSTSRANILALFISIVFLLFFMGRKKILVFTILVAIVLYFPTLISSIRSILNFSFSGTSSSDVVRLNLIINGFSFLFRTLGFGVGCGQIEIWMSLYGEGYIGNIRDMHNWWMEILTGYGVGVFVCYLIYYCKMFFQFFRTFRFSSNRNDRRVAFFICVIMVGFVIASVSSSSNITCEWLWVFWAICMSYQSVILDIDCVK